MTELAEPFIDSLLLFCDFVAHVLLIAGMRIGLALQHAGIAKATDALSGMAGVILDVAEIMAITLVAISSFALRRPMPVRRTRRSRSKPIKLGSTGKVTSRTRRRGTRPCPCRNRKRKK